MTEGGRGGFVANSTAVERFSVRPFAGPIRGAYGAGDSFAGALTYFLATGLSPLESAARAAEHGRAVLADLVPLDSQLPLGRVAP
jgi:ribokinase